MIELGFLHTLDDRIPDLLDLVSPSAGVALRSARYRTELQNLLEETQRQAEELQVQSEELRVSNEELEEQGRALKESQVRLEQQQVELEQTNSQLEEQAQQLETQRDDLAKSSAALELKARELEQASQYKSDFLANMSHELRTPLNSLLILSTLLGDNPQGNLSDEQVNYARTIQSSGNDLLTLINDILDLSKIEAGQIQIRPEPVSLQRLAADLRRTFQPVAGTRKLDFDITVKDGCPSSIVTDRQRLEQILKNLLSNAFKFTEEGGVQVGHDSRGGRPPRFCGHRHRDWHLGGAPGGRFRSLPPGRRNDQPQIRWHRPWAFDFKGAGAASGRDYHTSKPTGPRQHIYRHDPRRRTMPARSSPRAATSVPADEVVAAIPAVHASALPASPKLVADDRDHLASARRVLLVIEDDSSFASIVQDLAHEMGFECLIADTAKEALILAKDIKPSAIVLDVGLPDQSGLTVLDRLKRDDQTRHIPIHMVSATDHTQTALSLGRRRLSAKTGETRGIGRRSKGAGVAVHTDGTTCAHR